MNCPNEHDLLAYLNNKISDEKSNEIENHIDSCSDCRMIVVEWAKDHRPATQKSNEFSLSITKQQILQEGTKIGRFVILEWIGAGGMGTVYAAYDAQLDRKVALKVLHSRAADQNDSSDSQRLLREARSLAKLSHPNVVAVHEVGSHLDQLYMAMEFVEGQNLGQLFTKNSGSWKESLEILVEAGRGLTAAHAAGIVHRDFKPENVLIDKQGRVLVADFGLAKVEDGLVATAKTAEMTLAQEGLFNTLRTATGAVAGSPAYMSPEQFAGRRVDARSDQFSFCVVLYEGLYGETPFYGDTLEERKTSVENGQIRPAPEDTTVPLWLREVIIRGLQPESENRWDSVEELLERLADDPEKKAKRRRRRTIVFFAVFVLALAALIAPMAVWYEYSVRRSKLCKGAKEKIASVWNQKVKQDVDKAFLGTGVSYAKDTLDRVFRLLDAYSNEWEGHYTKACEATHLRGEQSDEVLDLRMGCLKKRLGEARALLKVFSQADTGVVQKAIQASSSLTGINICADEEALRAPYPPPKTDETKKKVASIREKLTEIKALKETGKYREGLKLIQTLRRNLTAVDYLPVQAEVMYHNGILLEKTGDYRKAKETLQEAARLAGESGDALLAAKAIVWLSRVVGVGLKQFDVSLSIAQNAEVMIGVAKGKKELGWWSYSNLCVLLCDKGEYKNALEYCSKSLAILEKTQRSDNIDLAHVIGNMGNIFASERKYDKAFEYYHKSLAILEKLVGSEHIYLAPLLNNLGRVLNSQGKVDEALVHFSRALGIGKRFLGPAHPDVAMWLITMGDAYLKVDYNKALECYLEVLSNQDSLGPKNHWVALAMKGVGIAYYGLDQYDKALEYVEKSLAINEHSSVLSFYGEVLRVAGQYEKAKKNLRKSISLFETEYGTEHRFVVEPLVSLGSVYLDQGKSEHAVKILERALRICRADNCDNWMGRVLFTLARALIETKGDTVRAIKLAKQSRKAFGKYGQRQKVVDEWLQKHDKTKSTSH